MSRSSRRESWCLSGAHVVIACPTTRSVAHTPETIQAVYRLLSTPQKVQVHTVHLRLSRRVAPVPYRTVLLSRPGMPIPTDTVILGTGRAAVPLLPYTFPFLLATYMYRSRRHSTKYSLSKIARKAREERGTCSDTPLPRRPFLPRFRRPLLVSPFAFVALETPSVAAL